MNHVTAHCTDTTVTQCGKTLKIEGGSSWQTTLNKLDKHEAFHFSVSVGVLRFFLVVFFRHPPRRDLHRPGVWLHHRLLNAALLCRLWQVIQRWGDTLHWCFTAGLKYAVITRVKSSSFVTLMEGKDFLRVAVTYCPSKCDKWKDD